MTSGFVGIVKRSLIGFFRWFIELTSDFLLGLVYRSKSEPLPPIRDFVLLDSALSLAAKIRDRKLTSEAVVASYISRIREINPMLNALVDDRFNEALQEARDVDKLISSGTMSENQLAEEKPFLGVPFTIKDSFQCKGLRQTIGLLSRKDHVSTKDAPVVQLMKDAGAILLGVTNVSEICMWWESNNKVYGRTCNPYDQTRMVGGSSGGEGCLISGAGSVIGVGSDVGGSIRIPSFFNGIFGHKGSVGAVPNDGQLPPSDGPINNYLSTGPMCRYASDLLPMFKVMSKANAKKLMLNEPVDISKLRFFYIEDGGLSKSGVVSGVHAEIKSAMREVVTYLEKAYKGVTVKKIEIAELKHGGTIWNGKMHFGSKVPFSVLMADQQGDVNCWLELLKWCIFMSNHTLSATLLGIMEKYIGDDERSVEKVDALYGLLLARLQDLLGDDGILLYPPMPRPAPYHNQSYFMPFNFFYTAVFNCLGLPVTQCPLGLSPTSGLPLGIQVVANRDRDRLTLAIARELERAFGGWVSPSPLP